MLTNINITAPKETIDLVSNQFVNMNEMKSFHVDSSPLCFYIPFGMEVMFNQLAVLIISHSGLKSVTNDDLKVFRHLRGLYLDDNELETLGENLFEFNTELQEISLSGNKLKNIAIGIFDSMPKLMKLELLRNPCIDKSVTNNVGLDSLIKDLKESCSTKVNVQQTQGGISFASFEALMNRIVELESKLSNLQSQFKDAIENICDICRSKV